MNIETVVVGYDGSDYSDRAIDAAMSIVNDTGTIHVVTAFDQPSVRQITEAYAAVPDEFTASIDLLSAPRTKLENAVKTVTDKGYKAVEHFVDDGAADAILEVAKQTGADLIVVGSRGLGRASAALRGSVSTKIAHHAAVDFMVVH